jgi:hypothetical protein
VRLCGELGFADAAISADGEASIHVSHYTPNECLVECQFNVSASYLILNREYILINVLKALGYIISLCNLRVTFLLKIIPRYFTLQMKCFVHSV